MSSSRPIQWCHSYANPTWPDVPIKNIIFNFKYIPMRQTARRVGHHFLNSFIQLARVDLGTSTMCGPFMFRKCFM